MFAATIFLSAFLLFNVQPLLGRYLLPWFGGSPAVWTTCLLFFQALLLGGYAYAHWLAGRPHAQQRKIHLLLLVATLPWLPGIPALDTLSGLSGLSPRLQLFALLAVSIGAPFFALASNAPLIQHWFGATFPERSPYRLYALSNAGSLLALLAYPLLMEPLLSLRRQSLLWSGGYLLYAAGCAWCLLRAAPPHAPTERSAPPGPVAVPAERLLLWVALPALASILLMATTSQLCQEVAAVPFLWVLPLGLYLCSFILTFDMERWYVRRFWGGLLAVLTPVGWWAFYHGPNLGFAAQLAIYPALLLVGCIVCHGELYALRPPPQRLTLFYLAIAAGGALGGICVTFAAPALFSSYREYELALIGICLATLAIWIRQGIWQIRFREPLFWIAIPLFAYPLAYPATALRGETGSHAVVAQGRNFFGTLAVREFDGPLGRYHALINGHIVHGLQFLDPALRPLPTSYYAPGSPVEALFRACREAQPAEARGLRVGVVGMGIGTMAAYGTAGDSFRFYEINPLVVTAAQQHFSYLSAAAAATEIRIGDGRTLLEEELRRAGPHRFDILAVDAFSSDAIPMHLLTLESARLYFSHLHSDGVVAIHITNRFLDLAPALRGLEAALGCRAVRLQAEKDATPGLYGSTWVALTRNAALAQRLGQLPLAAPWTAQDRAPVLFRDDYASLLKVLKL